MEERPQGWEPDLDDGVKVNIEPLQQAGVLRRNDLVARLEPETSRIRLEVK